MFVLKLVVNIGLAVAAVFLTLNAAAARSAAHTGEWWSFLGKYVSPTEAARYQWTLGGCAMACVVVLLGSSVAFVRARRRT